MTYEDIQAVMAKFANSAKAAKDIVVVIGAGTAGLEAGRVAALEGHKVTVFEKE
jgi:NADPH-dependent 2,4-dienoyl-CoA reductase/sulfur reductase-like enzyme